MRKLLALALCAGLFLIPALSLADPYDGALALQLNDAIAAGDEQMAAVVEVVNVAGFHYHAQENQVTMALSLSGDDVLTIGMETDGENLFLTSNLFGTKTLTAPLSSVMELAAQAQTAAPATLEGFSADATLAALQQALRVEPEAVTAWTEDSDQPETLVNVALSGEDARAILLTLKDELLANESLASIEIPDSDMSAPEAVEKLFTALAEAMPEGEFLTGRVGLDAAQDLVWLEGTLNANVNDDGQKQPVVFNLVQARTTADTVSWDGMLTLTADESAGLATHFAGDDSTADVTLIAGTIDEAGALTPLYGLQFDAESAESGDSFSHESRTAFCQFETPDNPVVAAVLHTLYTGEGRARSLVAEAGLSEDGPMLATFTYEGNAGETQPSIVTGDLHPVSEFTEEALETLVQDVIMQNAMSVAMGALSKLPPSALNLLTGGAN